MIRRGSPWILQRGTPIPRCCHCFTDRPKDTTSDTEGVAGILQRGTPIPRCCHCFIDRPKDKTSDTEGVALDIAAGNPYSTLLPLFHRST